jgi:hypothetical protein
LGLIFIWAALVAVLMSTEFLFQPFIWRDFSLDQIAPAWLAIARDRLVVAAMIATGLAVIGQPQRQGALRFAPYVMAVVAGAVVGEALLSWLTPREDRQDVVSWLGRILRWSVVGGAVAGMVHFWRAGSELAAAAEEDLIQAAQARRHAASSQLEMLRRQIEPHFLFNTLATIRRLHETDPEDGQRVLGRLFHYMSATLSETPAQRSTLADEVGLVCAYLDVCASRMSGRLTVLTEIEPGLEGLDFPPLVLATLAENAIKHGVFPQNGGTIVISARTMDDMVEVALIDDGVGLSGEGGGGLGLANIVERLRLLYGPRATLQLRQNAPRGVCAVVRIPSQAPHT